MTSSTAVKNPKNSEKRLLLCTDLDRTLLPNGPQPESPHAGELFYRLVRNPAVTLTYVTGRDLGLVEDAIGQYGIPRPDYLIGDVGTSIYGRSGTLFQPIDAWRQLISRGWNEMQTVTLAEMLRLIPGLVLQEPEKQGRFKLSYYAPAGVDVDEVERNIRRVLAASDVPVNLIVSRDEDGIGLIDILPAKADKYQAIVFLAGYLGVDPSDVIFSGDSGNDMDVLTSGINAVLVANSEPFVQKKALALAKANGWPETLYFARGTLFDLNGNYSGGILEGVVHFKPEFRPDLETAWKQLVK